MRDSFDEQEQPAFYLASSPSGAGAVGGVTGAAAGGTSTSRQGCTSCLPCSSRPSDQHGPSPSASNDHRDASLWIVFPPHRQGSGGSVSRARRFLAPTSLMCSLEVKTCVHKKGNTMRTKDERGGAPVLATWYIRLCKRRKWE